MPAIDPMEDQGASAAGAAGAGPGPSNPATLLAVSAIPLALSVATMRPAMQWPWPQGTFLGVHLVIETFVAVTAFATFAVQWYAAGARLGDARARVIGAAFLAFAILEVAHLVSFPGMPGLPWLPSSTERGIVYWLAGRFCTVGALVLALRVEPGGGARWLRRGPLLALALGGVAVVLFADWAWISRRPHFFVEGVGLTPLKRTLEALVALGAALGALGWYRAYRRSGDRSAIDLVLALGLTVLSEACFTLYAQAYDSFNLLGHLYLLVSSGWIFHALFVKAVLRPYAELERLRAHVEGELAETIGNLRSLQEQREDLLRAVSHDLRTPLQVVMLQAERLARMVPPGSRERAASDAMARAGRQMNALISDLVDSIYLEHGAMRLSTEPLRLGPFLAGLLGIDSGAPGADRFLLEVPADLPVVRGDPVRLSRVVQNLAGNALKYSSPGTSIRVEARCDEDELVVSIADRGAGIAGDDLPRIFERFYRGVRRGRSEGLGLGLYISRLIVTAHGGRIWCESRQGEGTTFSFTLPLGEASSAGA